MQNTNNDRPDERQRYRPKPHCDNLQITELLRK
jgi:hypothetical protein